MTPFLQGFGDELLSLQKEAKLTSELRPHQQRVVDRLTREDQPGLLVAHGLGSGKTLTSIAVQEALGLPSTVIAPAALLENYRKEIQKHTDEKGISPELVSLQRVAVRGDVPEKDVLVVDEAHRARETKTKSYQALKKSKAGKRVMLSASPFYNRPADIAPLIDIAAGEKVLPTDPAEFERQFVEEKKIQPGLWGRIIGVRPGSKKVLNPKKRGDLQKVLSKWVDYHPSASADFPSVEREDVKVPMTKQQRKIYNSLLSSAPQWMQYKMRRGLPPSKQELRQLNAFMTGARQASLSTRPYIQEGKKSEEAKVEAAFRNLKDEVEENPDARAVVYSNYLQAGLDPYTERLEEEGIPYGVFSGAVKKEERDQMVRNYNEGKLKALLLSSAGGEGLDLKGTSLIQILEPHFNQEKIKQVEGRGIRYKSHEHLPEEKRKVRVQRYLATLPPSGLLERWGLRSPGQGADEYLQMLGQEKEDLIGQFRELLQEEDPEQ